MGAVLFDLFETLVTEQRGPTARPLPSPSSELGIEDQAFRRAWAALKPTRMTSRLSYTETLLAICERLGHEPPIAVIGELDARRCADKASCFDPIEAAIVEMMRSLRAAGMRTAIVSNCSVEEIEAFQQSPLAALVDEVVWSFEVGVAKPDAAIYHLASERLAVDPAHATFVGDGSFDELDGAARAGLKPLWASWFVDRWPEHISGPRRRAVIEAGHQEVSKPGNLLYTIGGRDLGPAGHNAADRALGP